MLAEFYQGQDLLERIDNLVVIPYNEDEVLIGDKTYKVHSKRFQYDINKVTIFVREGKKNGNRK